MNTKEKILPIRDAMYKVNAWKNHQQVVVFTNGCFDLLHLGHIDYLEKAKQQGEKLVVGLNSDQSIKRLKGSKRPVNDENARARMLAALQFVDLVVLFDEDTPYNLIKALTPSVLVKGKDYEVGNIVGADIVLQNGGKVATIDLVEGYSSSAIIEKIQNLNK
jgi:rfaE bifunctional protein nucleotidyltransferase chain/domain